MKGNISLGAFIKDVKDELVRAQEGVGDPFYELKEVNLEVSFGLDASGKGGARLFVVELGAETKASQTHKVILKLEPIVQHRNKPKTQGEESKGTGGLQYRGPIYK